MLIRTLRRTTVDCRVVDQGADEQVRRLPAPLAMEEGCDRYIKKRLTIMSISAQLPRQYHFV
jgi:hypothetical protein